MFLLPTVCVAGLLTVGLLLRTPKPRADPVLQLLTVFTLFELALFAALWLVR